MYSSDGGERILTIDMLSSDGGERIPTIDMSRQMAASARQLQSFHLMRSDLASLGHASDGSCIDHCGSRSPLAWLSRVPWLPLVIGCRAWCVPGQFLRRLGE